jgi:mannitol/fructose-specific phosphotransferase system IIA component (Ntr-type)
MGKEALFIGSFLFAAGLAVFWFYGRLRTKKDFALLHLVEKVAAREPVDVTLEAELKDIIRERDDITEDRFDLIIEKSTVLDLDGPIRMEEFFEMVAREIALKTDMDYSDILKLLMEREKQASTVLSPSLAIPHMILPGENIFIILMARCRKGIKFPGAEESVKMVFVIAGTKDERTFHLRALSAIAQIVENPQFKERWMKAKNSEALRDLVLLGNRER